MDFEAFKRIVTAFSDDPGDFDLGHGKLLMQVRDEVIEATLWQSSNGLMVTENEDRLTAKSWVVKRLARLPQLAERICSHDESPEHFVVPSGELLERVERGSDVGEPCDNIAKTMVTKLGSQIPGTTSLWYLTSDAGEGKTSLINHLAVRQARAYKQKETSWLLVPIPLGGRTFLRFDDVVVAALVNRLRFQILYYDAFLELVKLGVIVPAFDGFEEMIIEGSSGEAVSALGQLVNNLGSAGTVLVATRKAYFEYHSLRTQARLFDSIGENDVAFGRMSLARWNREQFVKYGRMRGLVQATELYKRVGNSLKEDHPLLTRAVLVRRLVDVEMDGKSNLSEVLGKIGQRPEDYIFEFVSAIVEREAYEKWMDKSGEPVQPLLTVNEHHRLLSMLACEMWWSSTDELKIDEVDFIADIFTEDEGKSPQTARQIRERLKQHALLITTQRDRRLGFDHEDFRLFYLGFALGRALVQDDAVTVKSILDVMTLPWTAVDQAASYVHRNRKPALAMALLQNLAGPQPPASFVRENCGALTVALADDWAKDRTVVSHMNFPEDALRGRKLTALTVKDSYFAPSNLTGTQLANCEFVRCRFERLEQRPAQIEQTKLRECDVASIVYVDNEYDAVELYEPEHIRHRIRQCGFEIPGDSKAQLSDTDSVSEMSEDLKLVQRAVRVFSRATRVSENAMKKQLREKFGRFRKEVLPLLLKAGILEERSYERKGSQRRFGIAVPMRRIEAAIEESGGDLGRFVAAFGD